MKRLLWVVVVGTMACGDDGSASAVDGAPVDNAADSNDRCVPVPSGARALWRAENNPDNQVGGFTGTAVGNVTYGPGHIGNAFQFDGTTSAVKVDDMEMLWPQGSFTIEAWIKAAPTFTGTGIAILKYACSDVCIAPNDKAYYALYMVSGAPAVDIRSNSDADILKLSNTSVVVNDNLWHHLVGVRDNTAMKLLLYVDGTMRASMDLTQSQIGAMSDLDSNLDYVVFGASTATGTGLNTFFPGAVDDIAFYNRALSADEISAIYNAPEGICP